MNKTQLKNFQDILQNEEKITLESLKQSTEIHTERGDEIDTAQNISQNALASQFHARATLYLKKVQAALQRIEDDVFGICCQCEEEITIARLTARPTAEMCIACKEEQEGKETRNRSGLVSKSFATSRGLKVD